MKVIYKYILTIKPKADLFLPKGSKILSVGNQRGYLCVWTLQTQETQKEQHTLIIRGTGHHIRENEPLGDFIGTVILENLVWHVFQLKKQNEQ